MHRGQKARAISIRQVTAAALQKNEYEHGCFTMTSITVGSCLCGDVRFETGDYGLSDLTATVNVPIGNNIKTFVAIKIIIFIFVNNFILFF